MRGIDAGAEQVALAQAEIGEEAGIGRVAAAERDLAGRAFRDRGVQHHAVGRRARASCCTSHVARSSRGRGCAGAMRRTCAALNGIALGQAELAADDAVLGAGVAADVDALDIDARPLADLEGQVDRAARRGCG